MNTHYYRVFFLEENLAHPPPLQNEKLSLKEAKSPRLWVALGTGVGEETNIRDSLGQGANDIGSIASCMNNCTV